MYFKQKRFGLVLCCEDQKVNWTELKTIEGEEVNWEKFRIASEDSVVESQCPSVKQEFSESLLVISSESSICCRRCIRDPLGVNAAIRNKHCSKLRTLRHCW